jgi:hypothetical protein
MISHGDAHLMMSSFTFLKKDPDMSGQYINGAVPGIGSVWDADVTAERPMDQ